MKDIDRFNPVSAQGSSRGAGSSQSVEQVIESLKARFPGIKELTSGPKQLPQGIDIAEEIKTSINTHPRLIYVGSNQQTSSLAEENASGRNPHVHNLHMYAAFRHPELDPQKMNDAIDEVRQSLDDKLDREYFSRCHPTYAAFIRGDRLVLGGLFLHEYVADRVAQESWAFKPKTRRSIETLKNSGLEVGQVYTSSEQLPINRYVGIHIFPFVDYARRVMAESTDLDRRTGTVIWAEDYHKLRKDPFGHLPKMRLS